MTLGNLLKLGHMQPPVRRVLALDAGSRRLKLLLAESDFGRLRIHKAEVLDLQAEGLLSPDEIKTHLQARLEDWGSPPLALVLPQHVSISQVVDLPPVPETEVDKLIADETIKLSGVSESRIIYDFARTEAPVKDRQQFWVTLCQEGDIRERILQLGMEQQDICEVITTADALISAYRATCPLSSRAILVHMGAQTTVVVILLGGQGAFAGSFQMGGDFFTRALARIQGCPEETAESLKRTENLLNGPDAVPEFATVINGWAAELRRQLNEWFEHNPGFAAEVASFQLVASGGGFDQPGLLGYLNSEAALNLQPWPKPDKPEKPLPAKGFEIAFGAALQALGHSAQPVSLLPEDYRLAWRKQVSRKKIELASVALLVVCLVVLALGTWRQASLLGSKKALLQKVQAGQDAVQANEEMTAELVAEYEHLRPILLRQQNTLDTLKTLGLLQQSRSNRSFWFILLADQQSYFNPPANLLSTNRPSRTNAPALILEKPRAPFPELASLSALTNVSPAKPGLIVELCIPEDADTARSVLGQMVKDLKQQPLFSKVDLLSDDLRRNLADPKVILPDRHFVLALDFADARFQHPLPVKKHPGSRPPRPPSKRLARLWPQPEADGFTQVAP